MTRTLLLTALLTLAPVSELRGGLPFALAQGLHPVFAYLYCVTLNSLVAPLLYLFLNTIHRALLGIPVYHRIAERLLERARRKVHDQVERYGMWGLMVFVAVPLPVTGAYTGTLGAWILGLPLRKTAPAVTLGVVIAGIIVLLVTLTGIETLKFIVK
ncbi:small multi-drug export protein [Spirochaeta thermophila DSM 6578]|uniref:Small multi-drug export protein n=1 Tax=Winmispira thermophila (strain ATCC 700085 / DSM 6578 / Z-1203) TaxID=869211 RepID=G0GFU5_WINT7|nr:small multi-drug export protein [Spirochaeta thermophila]AEJ61638.1 small multi-drug export protein [Spirochaeta thermophila DSM 6578]